MIKMDDIMLITEIKKRPQLYDPRNVDFKDIAKREESWIEVATVISHTDKHTVDDVQNRWKVLRDRYVREKKGRKNGQAVSQHKDSWPLTEALKFLDKYVIHRKRKWSSSISLRSQTTYLSQSDKRKSAPMEEEPEPCTLVETCLAESDNIASPSNSVTTESSDVPSAKLQESKKAKDEQISPNDALIHFAKEICQSKQRKTDEEELFCLSIVPALRRLPHQKKAFAKLKIMELLYNYEFCDEPF